MGLPGEFAAAKARQVDVIIVEPGDRVLCTDGMTEGAARVASSSGSGCSPASSSGRRRRDHRGDGGERTRIEELRLLIHAILDH
jgi:hypothetical protein